MAKVGTDEKAENQPVGEYFSTVHENTLPKGSKLG
jgi:hypothetical protein